MYRLSLIPMILCVLSIPVQAQSLDEASTQIRDAWSQHTSMKATLRIEAATATGSSRINLGGDGTIQSLREGDLEKYKAQAKFEMGAPMTATMQVESIYDGSSLQITNETLGRRESKTIAPGVYHGAVPPGGALLLDALAAETNLDRLEDDVIEGTPVFVLEGRAKRGEEKVGPVSRLRAYVSKDTGALLKLEVFETEAVLTVRITQRDFEWDVELDPASFEPAGTKDPLVPTTN